ncbi:LuxR family transcriptional regulator [Pseudomonas fragi]|uniref:LuxR family transcriptional regulator n=1 Tax=Pseudomonas fragi TaxID=296 RepID=A0A9Q5B2I4_PSEFR|nr:LuxR family transcriptional regulator [Pseudomonas fragi]NNB50441.1 LuxR family transcriptional regulator [Pseudomonas fragi]
MVDMKNRSAIAIWKGCDPTVADAIRQFRDCWEPYSAESKRYPICRLVEQLIDPAMATYTATLPSLYMGHIPGAGTGVAFSEIMRLVGVDTMIRLQRRLLRAFVLTEDRQSERDQQYVATLETLIELVWACKRKQPAEQDVCGLNRRRLRVFCRLCGTLAELASFAEAAEAAEDLDAKSDQWINEQLRMSQLRGADEELRLSNLYCQAHRPKLPDNKWNPAYRKAKRSIEQFDLELARVSRQCASRGTPQAKSGDELVDSYIHNYMLGQTLQLADEAKLRNLARLMVDSRLSDRKKQILMLQRLDFNQSEIARRLGIERQAVSKAIASIPEIFRLSRPQ